MLKTFSLRADCISDFNTLTKRCSDVNIALIEPRIIQDEVFADVEVEFKTEASLAELQNNIRLVTDGHVMLQTLRQCSLAENTLHRDYSLF